jgi:ankyrin repeat protein
MKVTPLHWAAWTGHRNTVDYLISRGARLDPVDNEGRTPLFAAVNAGRPDVVDYLIQKGANINVKEKSGKTMLEVASAQLSLPGLPPKFRQALTEIVKMLTDHGAQKGTPPGPTGQTKPAGQ